MVRPIAEWGDAEIATEHDLPTADAEHSHWSHDEVHRKANRVNGGIGLYCAAIPVVESVDIIVRIALR